MISFAIRCFLTVLVNIGALYFVSLFLYNELWFRLEPLDASYIPWLLVIWVVFWAIDTLLWTILKLATFPLKWLTFWISSIVINAAMLYFFQYVVNNVIDIHYTVQLWSLAQTFVLSILLSILITVIRFIVRALF